MYVSDRYSRYVVKHMIVWTLAFFFWTVMREGAVNSSYPAASFYELLKIDIAIGIITGILLGTLEFVFEKHIYQKVPKGQAILIGSVCYILLIGFILFIGGNVYSTVIGVPMEWWRFNNFLISLEGGLVVFYFFLIGFLVDVFKQVDRMFGPGNLRKMINGDFYSPKEDNLVIMFLDLKSSTSIAEKIGHMQYSKLIQDCFKDLRVVENYKASIYQYVGDEVVLTWPRKVGVTDANCVHAFFSFEDRLRNRTQYYQEKYGVQPVFKAGLNAGVIVVAQVGEIKSEIAYHGDTINTASRIQEQCNKYDSKFLIASELLNEIKLPDYCEVTSVGKIQLKGKNKDQAISSVSRK